MIPIKIPQSLDDRRRESRARFAREFGWQVGQRLFAMSIPLRLCPLGAHSDHQKGLVTGFAIDRSIDVIGTTIDDAQAEVFSVTFGQKVSVAFNSVCDPISGDWANYVRGAVSQLRSIGIPLTRGIRLLIDGSMPIGGLSSSAAVSIAYLRALLFAHERVLSKDQLVSLVLGIENRYLGLHNGVLDQSVILFSQRDALTVIDCCNGEVNSIVGGLAQGTWEFLVVYSGLSRQLTATPFNQRVAECHEAARELLRLSGSVRLEQAKLGDVPRDVYEFYSSRLPETLAKRARHFFSEGDRVREGIGAWSQGNLGRFGKLITESGHSSIVNYESGSPALIALYEILAGLSGVYGARFCGGGFQGCCLALIDSTRKEYIVSELHKHYTARHPELAESYSIHGCQTSALGIVEELS